MVLFVGDCPSRLNTDPEVAFIGSKSYDVLQKWLEKINPKEAALTNSHTYLLIRRIEVSFHLGDAIVALGNRASSRLTKARIPHFKLPHPSPRNRLNNDLKFVESELKKCRNYLKGFGQCV